MSIVFTICILCTETYIVGLLYTGESAPQILIRKLGEGSCRQTGSAFRKGPEGLLSSGRLCATSPHLRRPSRCSWKMGFKHVQRSSLMCVFDSIWIPSLRWRTSETFWMRLFKIPHGPLMQTCNIWGLVARYMGRDGLTYLCPRVLPAAPMCIDRAVMGYGSKAETVNFYIPGGTDLHNSRPGLHAVRLRGQSQHHLARKVAQTSTQRRPGGTTIQMHSCCWKTEGQIRSGPGPFWQAGESTM